MSARSLWLALLKKLWDGVPKAAARVHAPARPTRMSSTQSTPKVTPQDKSFTVPLTGRWGNQLTSRPGSVSCSPGVLNGRAPCLMGTGQPRRKLLWQGRGGVLLGATMEQKKKKRSTDRRRPLMCFTVFVQYNCVSCREGSSGNVYSWCIILTS